MSMQDFSGYSNIEQELTSSAPIALGTAGQSHQEAKVPTTILNLFKTTQSGATSWNSHPAILLAVDWMKKHTLTKPDWRDKPLCDTIFTNIGVSPDELFSGQDFERLQSGSQALLIKAVYNQCTNYDDNIQLDKCTNNVADLNNYLWERKIDILITYYRQTFSIWPSDQSFVAAYRAVLCSRAYKMLKQMQAGSGVWLDANMEMFHHFVKLAACGASDDTINDIYRELTTVTPILEGGTFGEISPGHWRSYEAWISKGYLDSGDLNAQKLNDYRSYTAIGIRTAYTYHIALAEDIIRKYDYWKNSDSSCFTGETRVLMAGGGQKRISDVCPGDRVVSDPLTGAERKVAFISKPKRGRRPMYELRSHPGVRFTDTHPLIEHHSNSAFPTLRFVDKHRATSLNPSWQSFNTANINPSELVWVSDAEEERVVFDLVFEPLPQCDLPSYTVVSSTGQNLRVLSEAPLMAWFPLEMVFIRNVIQAVQKSSISYTAVVAAIDSASSSLQGLLRELRVRVGEATGEAVTEVSLQTLLCQPDGDPQEIADLVEVLIGRLGRSIGREIASGWCLPGGETDSSMQEDIVGVLLLHSITRISASGMSPPLPQSWTANISVSLSSPSVPPFFQQAQLDGNPQGVNTVLFYEAVTLDTCLVDISTVASPSAPIFLNIELEDIPSAKVVKPSTWVGGCPLLPDTQSLVNIGDITTRPTGDHAVLDVEVRRVPRKSLERRKEWTEERKLEHAAWLGWMFGTEIVEIVQSKKEAMSCSGQTAGGEALVD